MMDPTPRDEPGTTPQQARRRVLRLLARVSVGLGSLVILGLLGLLGVIGWYGREANNVDPSVLLDYRPPQVTRVLARDGTLIGELHDGERRTVVAYEALPQQLIDAFLAAEDADFFDHEGLDWPSIGRAAFHNLRMRHGREGASTITQQVIKNTLLKHEAAIERKSQELVLAGRVEAVLSKEQILEIYVNEIYFGEGRYGVVEAARFYFGEELDELDLGEMATLASLPNAPGVVTCYRRSERLRARRDYVLEQMVEHELIDASAAQPFIGQAICPRARAAPAHGLGEADEFVELARAELIARYGEDALATLGATVRTSVDLEVQRAARAAGRRELAQLEGRHGYGGHARPLSTGARARLDARAPARLDVGARYDLVVADRASTTPEGHIHASIGPHELDIDLGELASLTATELASRFSPGAGISARVVSPGIDGGHARAQLEPGPELAVAVAEVRSGELLALIGGRAFTRGHFDRARLAMRQPASAFKPMVYGAALRSGRFTAASLGHGGPNGEPMRLREALAQSDNAVALALIDALGVDPVHAFAHDLGLGSPLGRDRSLALGTSEQTPLELLGAYLTLARGGVGIAPVTILEVEIPADLRGVYPTASPTLASQGGAPSPPWGVEVEVAAALTDMLRSVIEDGTGAGARALGRPVAGKTGTTNEARDAWFVGFTPDHAAVTWVGFDQPRSLGRNESGASLALPIWLAAMDRASASLPIRAFELPPTLSSAIIDRETGAPACADTHGPPDLHRRCVGPERWRSELFLPGTEPEPSPNVIGERPPSPDADQRGEGPPIFAAVELRSLSIFAELDELSPVEREALRGATGALVEACTHSWSRGLEDLVGEGATLPELGTRLEFTLRFDARGRVRLRLQTSSGERSIDALAEAVLRRAAPGIASGSSELPALLFDPRRQQAEFEVEFTVGRALSPMAEIHALEP